MFRKVGAPAKKPAPPPPAAAPASASESESEASDSRGGSSSDDSGAEDFPAPAPAPVAPQPARKREPEPEPPAPVVGRTAEASTQEERIAQEASPAPPVRAALCRAFNAHLWALRPRMELNQASVPAQWAFQAAMSNDADREEHTHDPPPPEGTHLDRFGFICPLSESVSQSKEEAALELRRARVVARCLGRALTRCCSRAAQPADEVDRDGRGRRRHGVPHVLRAQPRPSERASAQGVRAASRTRRLFALLVPVHCVAARNACSNTQRLTHSRLLGCSIPNQLRGMVWQLISGSRDLRLRNPGLYQRLLEGTTAYEVDIIRDVSRTFPGHIHYCQRHGLGQRQLFDVLKAYALYDTEVGYVQGMACACPVFAIAARLRGLTRV